MPAAASPPAKSPPAARSRRQSSSRRLSGWDPNDLQNFIDENDDDAERNKAAEEKRVEAEAKALKARSPVRTTPGHSRRAQMYQDCIQMTTDNVRPSLSARVPHFPLFPCPT